MDASHLSGLEADKGGASDSALADHLVVHAYIELGARRLVDRLVDGALSADDGAAGNRVEGVQTSLHTQCLSHTLEPLRRFAKLEATHYHSAVLLQISENLLLVFAEVVLLSIELRGGGGARQF